MDHGLVCARRARTRRVAPDLIGGPAARARLPVRSPRDSCGPRAPASDSRDPRGGEISDRGCRSARVPHTITDADGAAADRRSPPSMIPGLSGSLLSHDAMRSSLEATPAQVSSRHHRWFQAWYDHVMRELGPASSARIVYDRVAAPLAGALGLRCVLTPGPMVPSEWIHALLQTERGSVAALLATAWGHDPAAVWRAAVRHGIAQNLRWCLCVTGPLIGIFDATRTYARRFAQFDLQVTTRDPASLALLWALLNRDAFGSVESALDRAVTASDRHRAEVRTSLQHGVHEALLSLLGAFGAARGGRASNISGLFDESLIVIYRILFLLFAEARGLVPAWHPIYREAYTIEALRKPAECQQKPAGLWESLQAIARLAHHGCRAGALRVTPFNGRLFSPVDAPLADSLPLDDAAVRTAMLALTTRTSRAGRQRIAYADLGVEQLGGVYERILDYAPEVVRGADRALTLKRIGRRKATGTFYTPRSLTEFMVRRALAPLVHERSPEEILALRVVDPAMGSGAFLVAACRYLASAYEAALIRSGGLSATDLDEPDRAGFRRAVAQRCLFGVDINPMAVQLGRLSLWLATLARDRPLTFLDHHLRPGNSLVGAALENVLQAPQRRSRSRSAQLPLFDLDLVDEELGQVIGRRLSLANDPGDTIEEVRSKERLLSSLRQPGAPLLTWQAIADLWCSDWFPLAGPRHARMPFASLVDELLGRGASLPRHISQPFLDHARETAKREQFFHWPLEFPEAFHDAHGKPSAQPGFDAVIGNPPWDMLRGDRGRDGDAALTAFTRRSGVYSWQGEGHANLYQLFLERAMRLLRPGGRLAVVLPSGFACDHGCATLRRTLLDRHVVDTFVTVENRDAIFPIHRGLKFLLLTASRDGRTTIIPCRSGVRSLAVLDAIPDIGDRLAVGLHRRVIEKLSGDQLAVPDVRTPLDAGILSRVAFQFPPLSAAHGWSVHFGRELNATDDRGHFVSHCRPDVLPIVEGKQVQPFATDVGASRHFIAARTAARLLASGDYKRSRLAYRDVAAATNRLTLIAAILPRDVVTTHTLFCVRGAIDTGVQRFLCGIFNSFVANYLVRMRVSTHVNVSIIEQLPVPRPDVDSIEFREVVHRCRQVMANPLH